MQTAQKIKTKNLKRRANGQFVAGEGSANPGGEPGWVRKRLNADFLTAFHQHFLQEGKRVIARVAKHQPAVYLRCLTLLVPKEMKVEHQGGIKAMTDEQLDQALAALRQLLADREAQAQVALIDVTPSAAVPVLPAPVEEDEKALLDGDK